MNSLILKKISWEEKQKTKPFDFEDKWKMSECKELQAQGEHLTRIDWSNFIYQELKSKNSVEVLEKTKKKWTRASQKLAMFQNF